MIKRGAAALGLVLACAAVAPLPAGEAGAGLRRGGPVRGLFGLSKEEVETFDFSRRAIDGTLAWRIRRTDRELLKLLRQRAKFVLQNGPDAMSSWNARIVMGITDQMGLGDGEPPAPPPPPEPPPPPDPPPPPEPPPPPPGPPPPAPPPQPPGTSTLIVPGEPDRSPLVLRVEGKLQPGMPLARPLPPDKARLFRQWVRAGASEQQFRAQIAPVIAKNCVFCHSRSTPSARLSLESWADVKSRIGGRLARPD